ncbi:MULTISPECIES: putative holin-like toxin [Alicyclobacillus]
MNVAEALSLMIQFGSFVVTC